MSRVRRGLVTILVLPGLMLAGLGSLAGCGGSSEPRSTALPDVSLVSFSSGPALELGELRGPAVINLWASTCGPCRREMPIYQDFFERYGDRVPVIGIDFEDHTQGLARQLVRRTGVRYPLYVDERGDLAGRAGMPVPRALPTLILVDDAGAIAHLQYVEITSVDQLAGLVSQHLGVEL